MLNSSSSLSEMIVPAFAAGMYCGHILSFVSAAATFLLASGESGTRLEKALSNLSTEICSIPLEYGIKQARVRCSLLPSSCWA